MTRLLPALLSTLLAAIALTSTPARAHSTGSEARAPHQCQQRAKNHLQDCLKCVKRPAKHHFHPDYPANTRCRIDNGRP